MPIITTLNIHKDVINSLGGHRFSNSEKLVTFDSEDTVNSKPEVKQGKKSYSTLEKKEVPMLMLKIQLLWDAQPSSSENIPRKLTLCMAMLVMIHNKGATELCIMKGQEGIVYDWCDSCVWMVLAHENLSLKGRMG